MVTGSEVLAGQVTDRNVPWVAQQLLTMGVDVAYLTVCGDRPADLAAPLGFLADQGVDLIVTTDGLGPTADDLTVETVAEVYGRELHLDEKVASRITAIVERWRSRLGSVEDPEPLRAGVPKQAMVPDGADSDSPVGTAPGVAVKRTDGLPAVLILPGPPSELHGAWPESTESQPVAAVKARADYVHEDTLRALGLSEADLAATLGTAEWSIDGSATLRSPPACGTRGLRW